jgi:DNA-binding beta-propeller fold protein YncE
MQRDHPCSGETRVCSARGRSRWLLLAVAVIAGCDGTRARPRPAPHPGAARTEHAHALPARGRRRARVPRPEALVTAESDNRLLVVDLRSGRVMRRVPLPAGPEYVAPKPGFAVVVSTGAGAVTLLDGDPLRVARMLRGFRSPHLTAISPDGEYAYVTDDAGGKLTVIRLSDARIIDTVRVGAGAHHLTISPDGRRVWIALGESARTIVTLTTCMTTCVASPRVDPGRPRIVGRFDPGFPAHDLSFTPDGRRAWISSAAGNVAVFRARDHRLLFSVPVGPPPQHITFDGTYAYLTSGYGSMIEKVATSTGRVLKRASAPHGSFEADAGDGFVAAASLLRGTLAIYSPRLRLLHVLKLAPATRVVAITSS